VQLIKNCCVVLCFSSTFAFGQEAVGQWQKKHPAVICIETTDYSQMTEEEKMLIGDNIIVYNQQLTMADIQSYESNQYVKADNAHTTASIEERDISDADYVKSWLGQNRDVKIIRQSVYSAMTEEDKAKYEGGNVLILAGETISKEDIESYENYN